LFREFISKKISSATFHERLNPVIDSLSFEYQPIEEIPSDSGVTELLDYWRQKKHIYEEMGALAM